MKSTGRTPSCPSNDAVYFENELDKIPEPVDGEESCSAATTSTGSSAEVKLDGKGE